MLVAAAIMKQDLLQWEMHQFDLLLWFGFLIWKDGYYYLFSMNPGTYKQCMSNGVDSASEIMAHVALLVQSW